MQNSENLPNNVDCILYPILLYIIGEWEEGQVRCVGGYVLHGLVNIMSSIFYNSSHLSLILAPTLSPLRPLLAELHSDTIIFRDDFDSYDSFSSEHW